MKKTFLAKLLAAFSGIALTTYGAMLACGYDFDYGYRYQTNFTPEVFVKDDNLALMLSGDLFYEGARLPESNQFNDIMVADWSEYLKGVADTQVVRYFLLDSSQWAVNAMYTNKGVPKIKGNFDRQSEKGRAFIKFLYLAKKVEDASVNHSRWNYYDVQYKDFEDENTIREIESIYKSTSDKFLKKRYWFQTLKAYFYSTDKTRTIQFFEKNKSGVEKDLLYYRGIAYVAGAHYRQKNYAQANYLFSLVFANCPELRHMALFNFHPQEQSDWNQTLALAKTNEEKAAVWALHGYYADEVEAIENIFKLHPKSKDLEFLLPRLINRVEMYSSLAAESPWTVDEDRNPDALAAAQLVSKVAESRKPTKPEMWNMAAGYLWTISRDFAKSKKHYDLADGILSDTLAKSQLRLLRLVDAVYKLESIDKSAEDRLLTELHWLLIKVPSSPPDSYFRYENAVNWVRQKMSGLYQKAENPVAAEIYLRKDGFYRSAEHRTAMKAFLEKSYFTPYENLMLNLYPLRQRDIYHFEAVTATLHNKIPEAIELMEKTDNLQGQYFLGDPFLGNIMDCHDCDHAAKKAREYTHLEFLEELQKKQDKIRKLEDVYTNSLLLGNAFYNLTHFGNGRTFYEDDIFMFGQYNHYSNDNNPPMQDVYNCNIAEKYYRQALRYAKTNEQKARCHYLLAKCERNNYYNQTFGPGGYAWGGQGETHFLAWEGFKALKQYSQTKFYRDAIRECGYFKTYVSRN